MNNIELLEQDLKNRELEDQRLAKENFGKNLTLTDDEKQRIDRMRKERAIMVSETSENGIMPVEIPIEDYVEPLNKYTKTFKVIGGNGKMEMKELKLLNNDDIDTSKNVVAEMKARALENFRNLSVNTDNLSDDDFNAINYKTIDALKSYFKMDILKADVLINKLSHMALRQICAILPKEFVSLYVTEDEIKFNNVSARERLISSISFLTVSGPEMDQLNDYIDNNNRLILVGKRLIQCQVDFTKTLESEETISEVIKSSKAINPDDTSFWAKYIAQPSKIHDEFAQAIVIFGKYKEAYQKIYDEYKDIPEYAIKTNVEDGSALDLIQKEINECDTKIQVYQNVTNLDDMKSLWEIIVTRFYDDKRISFKYIQQEAVNAIERMRRSKQNVSFPGYNPNDTKSELIYKSYLIAYSKMIHEYNKGVISVKKVETSDTPVVAIQLDGYSEDQVAKRFSLLLVILMGRLMKSLSKNTSNKYDAIMLDAYFKLFCKLGTDIYTMSDVWNMMKEFVEHSLNKWPE